MFAGKAWGDENNFPVILFHGLLDNCGSFSRLIEFLPTSFYYVGIDFPGHGKSSHFQDGIPLQYFNYVLSVRFIVDYFKFSKCHLIGHSLGAQIIITFAALYPENIDKIICLDGIIPEPISLEKTVVRFRKILENISSSVPGKIPPSYSYEEALDRLIRNRHFPLRREAGEALLERSLVPSANGFRFSSDQRLKGWWRIPMTLEQIKQFVIRVKCPILLILASDTQNNYKPVYGEEYVERLETFVKGVIDIKVVTVEGNHDVHNNCPERVLPHIRSFLLDIKSNL